MEKVATLIAVTVFTVVLSVAQEKHQPINTFKTVRNVENTVPINEYEGKEGRTRRQSVDYESPSNYQTQQRGHQQSSGGSCENVLEHRRGNFGFLSIKNPDYTINNITLEMTLASLLPSVSYDSLTKAFALL